MVVHGHFWTSGSSGSVLQRFGFKLLVRASRVGRYFSSALAQCYSSVGVIFQVLVDYNRPRSTCTCHGCPSHSTCTRRVIAAQLAASCMQQGMELSSQAIKKSLHYLISR